MTEFAKYISRIYGETYIIIRYVNKMPFSEDNKTLVEGISEVETYVVRTIWPSFQGDPRQVCFRRFQAFQDFEVSLKKESLSSLM